MIGSKSKRNIRLLARLIKTRDRFNHKLGWIYYKFMEMAVEPDEEEFNQLGDILGYKPGWAYYAFEKYYGNEIDDTQEEKQYIETPIVLTDKQQKAIDEAFVLLDL